MTRGYQVEEVREKLVKLLHNSKTGLSGVEISEKLGINRITMIKYLSVFAAEGLIRQKNIGNVTLWSVDESIEQFKFPDDYFQITPKFVDLLADGKADQVYSLIRNCIHSGATVSRLVSEVILPGIKAIRKLYDDGKIGNSEDKFLKNVISNALHIFTQIPVDTNPKKNIITISADSDSDLISQAASSAFYSESWQVFHLSDMSSNINVLFDLDLQKLLGKIWKQKRGIMIVAVFADTEEGLNFFANSINSLKEKIGKRMHLVLFGKVGKKTKIESDLISNKIEEILQWSQTVFENSEAK